MNQTTEKKRSSLSLWIGLAISAICIFVLLQLIDVQEAIHEISTADYRLVALGGLAQVVFLVLRTFRWRFMLNNVVKWEQVFHIQNIGYMLTMLLPFRLGDLIRAYLIGRVKPLNFMQGASSMVLERILDLLVIIILFPFAIRGLPELPVRVQQAAYAFGAAAIVGVGVLIFMANLPDLFRSIARWILDLIPFMKTDVWLERLDGILAGLDSLTSIKNAAYLLVSSFIIWVPILYSYWITMQAVGIDASWSVAIYTVCIAAFGVAVPSSPGQIGVFEAAVSLALVSALGQALSTTAASFGIIYHAVQYLVLIILGVIGLIAQGESFGSLVRQSRELT
ncbi:MAG: lysylphosphatidylglycerol synthase transmembrane domain-containing protein [Chloroflexota bacterium]